MKSMIEIVYKENKEQANGNEGYFHLPKNIRQVGDTNGRERIYLEDYVGTFLKKYFSAPEGRAAMLFGEFKWADGISYFLSAARPRFIRWSRRRITWSSMMQYGRRSTM